jgi:polyisoprenoid-binding protein YceI
MIQNKGVRRIVYFAAFAAFMLLVGPWVYVNFFNEDAPTPFSQQQNDQESIDPNTGEADATGLWTVTTGSQVGYRIKEQIVLRKLEAVGRTESVTGTLNISQLEVNNVSIEVDMKSVQSDNSQRDRQFRERIMDTDTYPKAFFELESSILLSIEPEPGKTILESVTGNLTLRGVTKEVVFSVSGSFANEEITITGQIPIEFSEWGIPNPSVPAVFIFTEPNGLLEFSLVFKRAEG